MAAAITDCVHWKTKAVWQISAWLISLPEQKTGMAGASPAVPVADGVCWCCVGQLWMHKSVFLLSLLPGWPQVVLVLQFQVTAVL